MAYIVGGIAGIVWFWFWIRGNWFAALLAAVGTGWIPLIDDKWRNEWQLCLAVLVVPWVPIFVYAVIRGLKHPTQPVVWADAPFNETKALKLHQN
jgi:UDP-N-acetylmuramyl pentapeptide phosphotransferase/UDP-N-acetylglucosamine-1-phosphate transferase